MNTALTPTTTIINTELTHVFVFTTFSLPFLLDRTSRVQQNKNEMINNERGHGMETKATADVLRALASNSTRRSKIGQLRKLFEEVEEAQEAGVSNNELVDALNQQGLEISLGSFVTMLHRIRKEKGLIGARRNKVPASSDATTGNHSANSKRGEVEKSGPHETGLAAQAAQAGQAAARTNKAKPGIDFSFDFKKPPTLKRSIDSDNK